MNLSIEKIFFSWFAFWLLFAGIGLYWLLPLRQSLRLGMDLVGGTYIVLEVQTNKAVETEMATQFKKIVASLKSADIQEPVSFVIENKEIIVTFNSPQIAQEAAIHLKESSQSNYMRMAAPQELYKSFLQKLDGSTVHLIAPKGMIQQIGHDAVQRNIEVLRTRLNPLSVGEIAIAAQGEKNIVVELPDVSDRQQAKAMIGKSAQLEFKLVEKVGARDDILYELDGELPTDKELVQSQEVDSKGNPERYYLVPRYTDITGSDLVHAKPTLDDRIMQTVVGFEFTPEGGEKFYELTKNNIGKALAIILDGVVISAPNINVAIRGSGQIQGGFTPDSARELALLLKSGAFVAPVTFEEERQIGPALGAESIRQGLLSCLVGLALLLIFSLFYYKIAGLLSFIALIYNLFLVLIGLSWLQATLTLPGIAGMVLTIGMAIDASILIYERIKEELASGTSFRVAVKEGFSDAMTVILDANITTFIVGVVLYRFGTGPIQGFAVTMMLGIISTLITGLFFLRSMFTFILDNFGVKKIKI